MDITLRRSVARLLRRSVQGLRTHEPTSVVLGEGLIANVNAWKDRLSDEAIAAFVRLRATQWRDAIIELLERLAQDWPLLVDQFALRTNVRLTTISEPLSDAHHNGRAVFALTFDDHSTVVYKPRSVDGEVVFGRIVAWMAVQGCEPRLRHVHALPRDGYGWTEYVPTVMCQTFDEATAYYERQGAFLALFFLLCGGDCNIENVVVHRDHPVWVDTECLCLPAIAHIASTPPVPAWIEDSVLSTRLIFSPNQEGLPPRRFVGLRVSCLPDAYLLFDDDDRLSESCRGAVSRGFRAAYEWILAQRTCWVADGGPLSWWRDRCVRVIFAPTRVYAGLAEALLVVPAHDRSATLREVAALLQRGLPDVPWRSEVIDAELAALQGGDIPFWSTSTTGRDVREANGRLVSGVAKQTGSDRVLQRAATMAVDEVDQQAWLIDTFLKVGTLGRRFEDDWTRRVVMPSSRDVET